MIRMAELYQKRPSEILGLTDEYTASCFDEACAYIALMEKSGEAPRYREQAVGFSQFYQRLGVNR